ncbi:MAG: radical SAM protein [Candidatus Helarchaeota archaeon]
MNGELKRIKYLHIEMGYRCNVRCTMCFQEEYSSVMDPIIWKENIKPLYDYLDIIEIQGGEPTVLKDYLQFIMYVLKINPNLKFGILTNGILFDNEWQQIFIDHGWRVNFSVNSASKGVYEKIVKYGNYDRLWENINSLLKKKINSNSDVLVAASFVIIDKNYQEITNFIEKCFNKGINEVRFFYDPTFFPKETNKTLNELDRAYSMKDKVSKFTHVTGIEAFSRHFCHSKKLYNSFTKNQNNNQIIDICHLPFDSLFIDHFGKVSTCCMTNHEIGDINHQKIYEILASRKLKKIRSLMSKRKYRYCQPSCPMVPEPHYGISFYHIMPYFNKFKREFLYDPKSTLKRSIRKIEKIIK